MERRSSDRDCCEEEFGVHAIRFSVAEEEDVLRIDIIGWEVKDDAWYRNVARRLMLMDLDIIAFDVGSLRCYDEVTECTPIEIYIL